MATEKNQTITTMISPDTLFKVIRLTGKSFSLREAARVLDIDVATLLKRKPKTRIFSGYSQKRVPRNELLRLLAEDGVVPPRPEDDQSLALLPPRIRRRMAKIRAGAGLM